MKRQAPEKDRSMLSVESNKNLNALTVFSISLSLTHTKNNRQICREKLPTSFF